MQYADKYSIDLLEKGAYKKRTNRQTSDKIWPISSPARTVFWTAKSQIPVAKPLKSCPITSAGFLLKGQAPHRQNLSKKVFFVSLFKMQIKLRIFGARQK